MVEAVIYGPAYSTYTRTARLVFEEKGQPYKLVEVDILKGDGHSPAHLARHPYGKVPTLEIDGFTIYETDAIERYVDEALPGAKLQPADVKQRARMSQIMDFIDNYLYGQAIGGVVINRLINPLLGKPVDEAKVREALDASEKALQEIEHLMGAGPYLAGPALSLADLHLAPILAYFTMTPEGELSMKKLPKLAEWWGKIKDLPSMAKTAPKF